MVDVAADTGTDGDSTRRVRDVDWLDRQEDEVWRLLLSVHADLLARLDEELRRGHGLNLADYDVLVALSESAGALRMSELADRVMLSPSGLTRRVDRLVERSLVTRKACPSDGRGSLAALTPLGRDALVQAAPTHVAGVRRYLLAPVTPGGLGPLAAGLRQVSDALRGDGALPGDGARAGSGASRPDRAPVEGGTPGRQPRSEPRTTGWPAASQPLVPPATETAG